MIDAVIRVVLTRTYLVVYFEVLAPCRPPGLAGLFSFCGAAV